MKFKGYFFLEGSDTFIKKEIPIFEADDYTQAQKTMNEVKDAVDSITGFIITEIKK